MGKTDKQDVAEWAVVGCILEHAKECEEVFGMLSMQMFSQETLGSIYNECYELHNADQNIDFIMATQRLGAESKNVAQIAISMKCNKDRVVEYAHIVRESWRVRDMQYKLMGIIENIGSGTLAKNVMKDVQNVLSEQELLEEGILDSSAKTFKECLLDFMKNMNKPRNSIKTGYKKLDKATGGLERGGLYIVSARMGEGKSDWALNLALRMSAQKDAITGEPIRVNYNTIEMTVAQCTQWCISSLTGIDTYNIREGLLSQDDIDTIAKVSELMCNAPIVIDGQESITAAEIKSKVIKHHPDVVFIDNLQIMGSENGNQDEHIRLGKITTMLKQIAKKHNIVIVLLAQMNRDGAKSDKPTNAHIRGTDHAAADADGIFFLRNDLPDEQILSGDEYCHMEVRMTKHRHGGKGVFNFIWQPQYKRFMEETNTLYE